MSIMRKKIFFTNFHSQGDIEGGRKIPLHIEEGNRSYIILQLRLRNKSVKKANWSFHNHGNVI